MAVVIEVCAIGWIGIDTGTAVAADIAPVDIEDCLAGLP